jgi:hypothetical protein
MADRASSLSEEKVWPAGFTAALARSPVEDLEQCGHGQQDRHCLVHPRGPAPRRGELDGSQPGHAPQRLPTTRHRRDRH